MSKQKYLIPQLLWKTLPTIMLKVPQTMFCWTPPNSRSDPGVVTQDMFEGQRITIQETWLEQEGILVQGIEALI